MNPRAGAGLNVMVTVAPDEDALLEAARDGDEAAFRGLVEPHYRELHAHCYRMLASVHDADDALQDALLRAWRGMPRFQGRSSLRSWLYRIATNTSLDLIAHRPTRVLPLDDAPAAERAWVEPYADERLGLEDGHASPHARFEHRESVELAFVAALQHLAPNQRAALILRDVMGFSAKESAAALETTVPAVNGALRRARRGLDGRLPDASQQTTLRALGDAQLRAVVERYTRALEDGDVDGLLALLTADAAWSMPPDGAWFRGHAALAEFLRAGPLRVRWRHLPAQANGQPAVGCYAWDEARGEFRAAVLDVLSLRGGLICDVTAFVDPALFPRFGLPDALPAR